MSKEILVINDDGFRAKGINTIAQFLRSYGNVTVVAPSEPQSGKSASITLEKIIEIEKVSQEDAAEGKGSLRIYSLSGTPVDCAKLGCNLFKSENRMPDLLVSGINHGSNASAASLYSGTLGAAAEGTMYDIPSIGFSIDTHNPDADLTAVIHYAGIVLDMFFKTGISKGTYLNVNCPDIPLDKIKGIRIARRGMGRWVREFDHRVNPHGQHYFWMVGDFEDMEPDGISSPGDHRLMEEGYVTVVPHKLDNTDYQEIERLQNLWKF